MAYQKSTSFSGFRKRTAQDNSKQYKDLAKNLESENTKTLKDFQTSAASQITEMQKTDSLHFMIRPRRSRGKAGGARGNAERSGETFKRHSDEGKRLRTIRAVSVPLRTPFTIK